MRGYGDLAGQLQQLVEHLARVVAATLAEQPWIVLVAVVLAMLCAIAASGKGRSGTTWFLWGLLTGPVALGIVVLLPEVAQSVAQVPAQGEAPPAPPIRAALTQPPETKNCPFCAETIKYAAKVCRYCGRDLVPMRPTTPQETAPAARGATIGDGFMLGCGLILAVVVFTFLTCGFFLPIVP